MSLSFDANFLAEIAEGKVYDRVFLQKEWPKLEQAAQVHGYRGASKKKETQLYCVSDTDKGLFKTLEKLVQKRSFVIPQGAIPIKAVAHCPSGNRLVGYYYPEKDKYSIKILGVANYAD